MNALLAMTAAAAKLGVSFATYVAVVHPMVATVAAVVVIAGFLYAAYRVTREPSRSLALRPQRSTAWVPTETRLIRLLRGEAIFDFPPAPG